MWSVQVGRDGIGLNEVQFLWQCDEKVAFVDSTSTVNQVDSVGFEFNLVGVCVCVSVCVVRVASKIERRGRRRRRRIHPLDPVRIICIGFLWLFVKLLPFDAYFPSFPSYSTTFFFFFLHSLRTNRPAFSAKLFQKKKR